MLKKIFKHEFAATGKILWIVYAASFGLSLLTFLLLCVCDSTTTIGSLIYSGAIFLNILGLIAVIAGTVVMLTYRFAISMAGREAYFTYSLPVKNSSHLTARFLIAMIYALITGAILVIEIGLLIIGNVVFYGGWSAVGGMFAAITDPGTFVSVLFFILLFCFILLLIGILELYAALALGTYFTKNRVLGTVISLFIFSVASNIVSTLLMLPFLFVFEDIINFLVSFIAGFGSVTAAVNGTLWLIFLIIAAIYAIYGAVYYLITHKVFSKKLRGTDS